MEACSRSAVMLHTPAHTRVAVRARTLGAGRCAGGGPAAALAKMPQPAVSACAALQGVAVGRLPAPAGLPPTARALGTAGCFHALRGCLLTCLASTSPR